MDDRLALALRVGVHRPFHLHVLRSVNDLPESRVVSPKRGALQEDVPGAFLGGKLPEQDDIDIGWVIQREDGPM